MNNKIKIEYTCPYGEIYGVIGYVMAEKFREGIKISNKAYKRACGKLPIGGVAPNWLTNEYVLITD